LPEEPECGRRKIWYDANSGKNSYKGSIICFPPTVHTRLLTALFTRKFSRNDEVRHPRHTYLTALGVTAAPSKRDSDGSSLSSPPVPIILIILRVLVSVQSIQALTPLRVNMPLLRRCDSLYRCRAIHHQQGLPHGGCVCSCHRGTHRQLGCRWALESYLHTVLFLIVIVGAVNQVNPWSGALDVPLSLNDVYSLAAPFIKSCPSSNPPLPVKGSHVPIPHIPHRLEAWPKGDPCIR
jgi:hypothetical protein